MFCIVSSTLSPRATKRIKVYGSKEEAARESDCFCFNVSCCNRKTLEQGKNNLCLRASLVKRFTTMFHYNSWVTMVHCMRMKGTTSCLKTPHFLYKRAMNNISLIKNLWGGWLIHYMRTSSSLKLEGQD